MNAEDMLQAHAAEAIAVRRDIHAHPETAFEEHRTSDLIARLLSEWGWQVTTGLGGTGVVGTLSAGHGSRALMFRADFDALPIQEDAGLPWGSKHAGRMHACGHDGHTAILLAAARYLAHTRCFSGTVHVVFQPAEEITAGAFRMVKEGLFRRFPADRVYGLHNIPGQRAGTFAFREGPFWAAHAKYDIELKGFGAHGAKPHLARDPIVAGSSIVMALQTIVSRNVDPLESAVITTGVFRSGDARNVIADRATLQLSVRSFTPEIQELLARRIREVATAQAAGFDVKVSVADGPTTPPVCNDPETTIFARELAQQIFGGARVDANAPRMSYSDDFSVFGQSRPACYVALGNGDSHPLHNPGYDFNDGVLIDGARLWVKVTEAYLSQ